MTFQVTGRPLISFGKHSGLLLMGLRYGRGDVAPARCPHPLPTSPEDQGSTDHVSGREKPDTSGRELEWGPSLVSAVAWRAQSHTSGHSPCPAHRSPSPPRADPGIMGQPSEAWAGWTAGGRLGQAKRWTGVRHVLSFSAHHLLSPRRQGTLWGKNIDLGTQAGPGVNLILLNVCEPQFSHLQNGSPIPTF